MIDKLRLNKEVSSYNELFFCWFKDNYIFKEGLLLNFRSNNRYNFRNICKYDNFYKPEEANKDFFASVLFETSKDNLLDSDEIIFYLIGGSTRAMMDSNLCYIANLVADDDMTQELTNYKVIDLKNALDISGFECYMQTMGYTKIH